MSAGDVCWRQLLNGAMANAGDPGPIIHCTLSDEQMGVMFDNGFGANEGRPFTAWTETRVYFPTDYDGAENVSSAPRSPCDESVEHIGGGGTGYREAES